MSDSGETNIPIGDWSVGSLKVYHDDKIAALKELTNQRFADNYIALIAALTAQEKAIAAALQATKEAINKAEAATEKRFESVNEFRKQLGDQTNTFLPRLEYDAQQKALESRVSDITNRINTTEGRGKGVDKTIAYLVTAVSIAFGAVGIILAFNN